MKGGSKKTTQTESRAPWYEEAGKSALSRADALSGRPYEAFTGSRVAGLGANELKAQDLAGSLGSRYQPFLSRLQTGFTPGALSQFENPYLDKVLGARKRAIGEEFGRQEGALARNQNAMDAFRSGRSDLMRARLGESRLRALDEAEGTARSDAFNTALQAFFQQGQQDLGGLAATQGAAAQELGALSGTGATERGVRQAQSDFNYGQFLEGRDWDVNNLNTLLAAIGAVNPTAGGTTTQQAKGGSGVLDTVMGLAGAASSMFGSGMFGK